MFYFYLTTIFYIMKILFLISSLYKGGAERIAVNVFNELSKNSRYKIFFHTLEKDKHYELNLKIEHYL